MKEFDDENVFSIEYCRYITVDRWLWLFWRLMDLCEKECADDTQNLGAHDLADRFMGNFRICAKLVGRWFRCGVSGRSGNHRLCDGLSRIRFWNVNRIWI